MKVNPIRIKRTYSVCPECRKGIEARLLKKKDGWYMQKACPEHGAFETVIWRGSDVDMEAWSRKYKPPADVEKPRCPVDCGLCGNHLQTTCCVLVEVTKRCNLECRYCFAESGADNSSHEKSTDELYRIFRELVGSGRSFVQLSGGEPTVRDDLPEIVSCARRAGCESIQLNSNGIRLGMDREYMKKLADNGLSFVFMQFDGLDDEVYVKLRGRTLLKEKLAAIELCDEFNIGVTLVPTLVPGINDNQIGQIVKFAIEHSPAVRGVHFQPVSYFGRTPQRAGDEDRITLPEVLLAIEEQTKGLVKVADLVPSACDHPRCGFHGDFIVLPDKLMVIKGNNPESCCEPAGSRSTDLVSGALSSDQALRNRRFVSRRWKRSGGLISENLDMTDFDAFLSRVRTHGFTITGMAFQDAYNLDTERLRRCSLHVYDEGRIVPFCAYYM